MWHAKVQGDLHYLYKNPRSTLEEKGLMVCHHHQPWPTSALAITTTNTPISTSNHNHYPLHLHHRLLHLYHIAYHDYHQHTTHPPNHHTTISTTAPLIITAPPPPPPPPPPLHCSSPALSPALYLLKFRSLSLERGSWPKPIGPNP